MNFSRIIPYSQTPQISDGKNRKTFKTLAKCDSRETYQQFPVVVLHSSESCEYLIATISCEQQYICSSIVLLSAINA